MSRRFSKNQLKDKRKKKLAHKLNKRTERRKLLFDRVQAKGSKFSDETVRGLLEAMALTFGRR